MYSGHSLLKPETVAKVDPNKDPNVIRAKWLKGFNASLERMEQNNQSESREWTQRSTENRINRLKAMDSQVTAEFDLIRRTALEEKASKTVEAIDLILGARKERLEKLIESIEEAKKEDRRKEMQEKQEKREREMQRRKDMEERRR